LCRKSLIFRLIFSNPNVHTVKFNEFHDV
jgi:hypothetical protein